MPSNNRQGAKDMSQIPSFTNLISAARQARPDLPQLGVQVEQGKYEIVYYPNHGKGQRRDWHKGQTVIASGLELSQVAGELEKIAGGVA
jgi:hypothetical protein